MQAACPARLGAERAGLVVAGCGQALDFVRSLARGEVACGFEESRDVC